MTDKELATYESVNVMNAYTNQTNQKEREIMGQWRINTQGKRVHKRNRRRRANRVWFYKVVKFNNGDGCFVYTSKPRSELAYPDYYKYALRMIYFTEANNEK